MTGKIGCVGTSEMLCASKRGFVQFKFSIKISYVSMWFNFCKRSVPAAAEDNCGEKYSPPLEG